MATKFGRTPLLINDNIISSYLQLILLAFGHCVTLFFHDHHKTIWQLYPVYKANLHDAINFTRPAGAKLLINWLTEEFIMSFSVCLRTSWILTTIAHSWRPVTPYVLISFEADSCVNKKHSMTACDWLTLHVFFQSQNVVQWECIMLKLKVLQ